MTKLAEKRLRRAEEAEEQLRTAKVSLAELDEHYGAALVAKRKYSEIGEQLALMPTWQPVQLVRGQKQYDFHYLRAIYAQFANDTPKSAIGRNIVSTVKLIAPWLNPVPPSLRTLSDCHFSMRTVVECLGGRDAAAAWRIRMLGNDESSKYGNAAIT